MYLFYNKLHIYGETNEKATSNELEEAIQELVGKGIVSVKEEPSMGCNVKWK